MQVKSVFVTLYIRLSLIHANIACDYAIIQRGEESS